MLGKISMVEATPQMLLAYRHYTPWPPDGESGVWCGGKVPVRRGTRTHHVGMVTCPWCRDVIRQVVADWDAAEAATHAPDLGGEAGGA